MIYQENFSAQIKGLLGFHNVDNACYNYKLLEECCTIDYKKVSGGVYPRWNIQEQGADWPEDIKLLHSDITQKSITRAKRVNRRSVV